MKVLVTGGAGFVGSHTAVELAAAGHEPVLFDNLSNARRRTLGEAHAAAPGWRMAVLRYFNAAGAHPGGSLGEDAPHGPGNLLARLGRVALGLDDALEVYGGSWPTADGTCVRDYVHVVDVARANVAALEALEGGPGVDLRRLLAVAVGGTRTERRGPVNVGPETVMLRVAGCRKASSCGSNRVALARSSRRGTGLAASGSVSAVAAATAGDE